MTQICDFRRTLSQETLRSTGPRQRPSTRHHEMPAIRTGSTSSRVGMPTWWSVCWPSRHPSKSWAEERIASLRETAKSFSNEIPREIPSRSMTAKDVRSTSEESWSANRSPIAQAETPSLDYYVVTRNNRLRRLK